jgi:hypothetical protein
MKRPSFQFYPADWLGNANLRRCTHAEKGVWIDVLCLMHDSEEYGVLRWPLKEIAAAIGCKPAELKCLISKGVLKGSDTLLDEALTYTPVSGRRKGPTVMLIDITKGPLWYSSRMVIDEYKRLVRGGKDESPNPSPKGGNGDGFDDTPNPSPSRAGAHAGGRPSTSSSTTTSLRSVVGGKNPTHDSVPVPADLQPDRNTVASMQTLNVEPAIELAKFIAHHEAQGTMLADSKAWQARFRKWLLDAHQFNTDRHRVTQARVDAAQRATPPPDARSAAADTLGVGSQYLAAQPPEPPHAIDP